MRAPAAALAVVTLAGVAGGAAAQILQAPRTLRVPEDVRVVIVGATFAPGFPRSTELEAAGDVNGDGKRDLLVLNVQGHAGDEARSHLIPGGRLPARLRLDRLGRHGVTLLRSRNGDRIRAAGDVNGDGRADLVRCGRRLDVLLGSRSLRFGRGDTLLGDGCATAAGDVDGDDVDDLLVTEYRAGVRQWIVVFGKRGPRRTLDLGMLGRIGFRISTGRFGEVEPLGDLNGDGRADLGVIGFNRGSAILRLVLGRRASGTLVVGERRPVVTSAGFRSFGPAGDVNGDGIGDLAVAESGRACAVFGRRSWPSRSGCTATRGLIVRGTARAYTVSWLEPAGDVDGDGLSDVLVGAPSVLRQGSDATGAVYLVYGRREPGRILLPADSRIIELAGGPKLYNDSFAEAAGPGDLTADGRPDVVLGSGWSGDGWVLSP